MGFLKFLKKKEAKPGEEIDIPPPPPLPSLPSFPGERVKKEEKLELPPLPPLEPITSKPEEAYEPVEFPEPSIEPESAFQEAEEPRFPPPSAEPVKKPFFQQHKIPPEEFRIPAFRKPLPKPRPMMHRPFISPIKEREEKREVFTGPLFIKQDTYKAITDGISIIKNKLKESDSLVLNLNNIKNKKDEEFEKWRTSLEGIQRKLLYVDKTLYER